MGPAGRRRSIGLLLGLGLAALVRAAPAAEPGAPEMPERPGGAVNLEAIVHAVETVTEYADRSREHNTGSGFVVGRHLITVHHNVRPSRTPFLSQTTRVDGVALQPVWLDPAEDVAIFELPEALCRRHCNGLRVEAAPPLRAGREVYWLRKFAGEQVYKRSRIRNLAAFGGAAADPYSCAANLVVEVQHPFVPGSSGAPVLDAESGAIIGMIQGSFAWGGAQTGFFKPIQCIAVRRPVAGAKLGARHPDGEVPDSRPRRGGRDATNG